MRKGRGQLRQQKKEIPIGAELLLSCAFWLLVLSSERVYNISPCGQVNRMSAFLLTL